MKTLIKIFILTLITINISYSQVTEDWVQRFTSDSTRDESVNDMFVDQQGNVYVTGSQKSRPFPNQASIEAVTVKYNSQGVQQWIQNYHSPINAGAFSRAIHVDAAGNVYVTGESNIYSGGANRALIIKYSPSGTQLWSYLFAYSNAYNGGYDIITDASGNVYVTGEYNVDSFSSYNNIFLVKFGPSGNLINQTFYHNRSEGARKIGMDGNGKIIVGGYINGDSLSFIALKYEQNLDFVWAARTGQNIGNINPIEMEVDINSNIILAGTEGTGIDYSTIKINNDGVLQWRKYYNSSTGWDMCRGLAKDNSGNVYVTGETGTGGLPLSYDFTTIKYDANGNEQWVRAFDASTTADGYRAYDIAVDDSQNVYVTGQKYSTADITTVKYNSAGTFQWSKTYNGPSNSADLAVALAVDGNGNTYVTGNSNDFASGYDIVIIKYIPSSIGIQNISSEIAKRFSLSQNYPNPFNPVTKIRFNIVQDARGEMKDISLIVYDISGKEIEKLYKGRLSAGTYEVDWNGSNYSSGVYFYKLQSSNFVETKKMMLTK